MIDCPVCGKPDSAWGDTFCGECEGEYRMKEYERFGNAYLHEWGLILFMVEEVGLDYLKHPKDLPPVTEPFWAMGREPHTIHGHRKDTLKVSRKIPGWVREERLKAIGEAISQFQATGQLTPPDGANNHIPVV